MDNPQPQPEERRLAQHACKSEERREQPYFYETLLYDQETEIAADAAVIPAKAGIPLSPSSAPPTPEAG